MSKLGSAWLNSTRYWIIQAIGGITSRVIMTGAISLDHIPSWGAQVQPYLYVTATPSGDCQTEVSSCVLHLFVADRYGIAPSVVPENYELGSIIE